MERSRSTPPPIAVVPHDPRWQCEFERTAAELHAALGSNLLAIHHIGSTAIPELHAKPVIDMLAVVADVHAVDGRTGDVRALCYEVMGEFGIAGRRYFRRDDSSGRRTHQLRTFVEGSPHVRRHIAFWDFMRANSTFANPYGELKRRLAEAHPYDMEAYMDGKDAFVKEMEARALEWSASPGAGPTAVVPA